MLTRHCDDHFEIYMNTEPASSCGIHQVQRRVAFSSPCHGMCLSSDIGVLRKGGIGRSVTLPAVFKAPIDQIL